MMDREVGHDELAGSARGLMGRSRYAGAAWVELVGWR